jgi:hypothetical protein
MLVAMPKGKTWFGVADEVEWRFRRRILVESIGAAKRVVLAGTAIGAAIPTEIERELKEGLCAVLPWKRHGSG